VCEELCLSLGGAVRKTGFLIHGLGDGNIKFLSVVEISADFIAEFALGDLDVVLLGTFSRQQIEEFIINVDLEY